MCEFNSDLYPVRNLSHSYTQEPGNVQYIETRRHWAVTTQALQGRYQGHRVSNTIDPVGRGLLHI